MFPPPPWPQWDPNASVCAITTCVSGVPGSPQQTTNSARQLADRQTPKPPGKASISSSLPMYHGVLHFSSIFYFLSRTVLEPHWLIQSQTFFFFFFFGSSHETQMTKKEKRKAGWGREKNHQKKLKGVFILLFYFFPFWLRIASRGLCCIAVTHLWTHFLSHFFVSDVTESEAEGAGVGVGRPRRPWFSRFLLFTCLFRHCTMRSLYDMEKQYHCMKLTPCIITH